MAGTLAEKKPLLEGRLPSWFRQEIPQVPRLRRIRQLLADGDIHTVCESAHCPNSGKCWSQGVVTVLILGNACTRRCGFCAVEKKKPSAIDAKEPEKVAQLVAQLNLRYVVVTSVTRDDLADGGAQHFAQTIGAIRARQPQTKIEVLIPDFQGVKESLQKIVAAGPDVIAHNMEMPRRLFPKVRPQADYNRSLNILSDLKSWGVSVVKSGFMVGLGETDEEIQALLADLAQSRCDLVTIGQYLAPSKEHVPVARFVEPQMFGEYQKWGEAAGIPVVVSGPLVRSSFLAEQGFSELLKCRRKG